eukprot:4783824-Prymnesium_polylepis.1
MAQPRVVGAPLQSRWRPPTTAERTITEAERLAGTVRRNAASAAHAPQPPLGQPFPQALCLRTRAAARKNRAFLALDDAQRRSWHKELTLDRAGLVEELVHGHIGTASATAVAATAPM